MENAEWQKVNLAHGVTFATEAAKAIMLLNGGAAIALLALIGATGGKESTILVNIAALRPAMHRLGFGAAAAAAVFAFAYLSQIAWLGVNQGMQKAWIAQALRIAAGLSFVASIWWFMGGINGAMLAVSTKPA